MILINGHIDREIFRDHHLVIYQCRSKHAKAMEERDAQQYWVYRSGQVFILYPNSRKRLFRRLKSLILWWNGLRVSEYQAVYLAFTNRKTLSKGECIHHLNYDRKDNRFENLCSVSREDHASLHHRNRIFSVEHRKKLSISRKEYFKRIGKRSLSEEHKRKISEAWDRKRARK